MQTMKLTWLDQGEVLEGFQHEQGLLLFQGRYFIRAQSKLKEVLLSEFHDTPSACHGGSKKMVASGGLLQPLPTPTAVWEDISIYFITRLSASKELFIVYKDPIFESQDLSTSNIHQQSLANAGSETRPPMLERGEALVSVYNRFAQLMNDLERNVIIFPKVTVNTKFLNCLQPEWLKYVTQVRLAKRLIEDSYGDLFDYLQQFKKLVNASGAKKIEKSHDPLALVAHTGSSSRTTTPYYVTHPSSVVDYDDDYQGDAIQHNSEDPLTSAMILLARAITKRFFNLTNNRLRTSSNTRNQAIVQEEIIEGNNAQNDAGNIQRTLRTTPSGTASNVQCYNCSEKGHYAYNCPKPRVRDSKYFMEQMLLAKQDEAGVILTDEHNDFLFADASRMEEIEELSANICLMARIQPANFDSDEGPSYDSAFLSDVLTPSTSYVNLLFAKDTKVSEAT
ncbi:gag-pol polyprotein [Tanacetum coccineum]